MAYSTTNLYPEDLNGTNPLNLITNEIQNLQVPGPKDFYFIIPHAAPFFVDSLKVFNVATGARYVEDVDYLIGHRFVEAMNSVGRPIAGSIRFMRMDIVGQVRLEYRTIGGNWGFSDVDILRELANKRLNPLIRSWGDIGVLPYSFPPMIHDQPLNQIVGSKELNLSLTRIADILEATAAGTSASHITNYQNPHRVTATQVGLGNVPNFKMATDVETLAAARNDLFVNPRGVLLSIQEYALKPLKVHVDSRGNVHGLVASEIGLGRVPNYAAATPAQAVDPTNDSTLLTPYTASLLVQKLQNDPRLDQLITDFQNHLTANNPHDITPAKIGTYTSQEIDQKLSAVAGGNTDAKTFNNETPEQWVSKFPSNSDINTILTELGDTYQTGITALNTVDMDDPITPSDLLRREAQRVSWAYGGYAAYGLYNSLGDLYIVSSSATRRDGNAFPTTMIAAGAERWSSDLEANYMLQADDSIHAWGLNIVPIPAGYAVGAGFVPANASSGVWSSRDYIWVLNKTTNLISRIGRTGAIVSELPGQPVMTIYVNNGMVDPRPMGIAQVGTDWSSTVFAAIGDASWKTALNAVITSFNPGTIHDVRVATEYINFIINTGSEAIPNYKLRLYKINFGASITLTEVTATTMIKNHTTGLTVAASTLTDITQIAGSYTHFVFTRPRADSPTLCDLLSFGDNSQGQLEMLPSSAPFLSMAAGYQYTVTVNRNNYAEFWGNSPDNSLLYHGGNYIPASI